MKRGLTLLCATVATLALSAGTRASPSSFTSFKTPSGNIGCISDSEGRGYLRCDIRSGLRPQPRRPASCDLDYGHGLEMRRTGGTYVLCAGDTALDPRAAVLGYGRVWRGNGFRCTSRTTGLTCSNQSGHGFFLSRESYRRF